MISIRTIESEVKLKEVFNFMSKIFYEEAIEFNERYYTMSERFNEMSEQFKKDNYFLLYVEENNEIVASLTSKNMDDSKQKITLGVMAVAKKYRRKGYATALVKEFEKRCVEKNIRYIDLGARFRACPLYISLNYRPLLMVQVFDFANVEEIKKVNVFNLEKDFEWQGDTYGFIFFKVDEVNEEYIKHFENKVPNSQAQYIFKKDLLIQ